MGSSCGRDWSFPLKRSKMSLRLETNDLTRRRPFTRRSSYSDRLRRRCLRSSRGVSFSAGFFRLPCNRSTFCRSSVYRSCASSWYTSVGWRSPSDLFFPDAGVVLGSPVPIAVPTLVPVAAPIRRPRSKPRPRDRKIETKTETKIGKRQNSVPSGGCSFLPPSLSVHPFAPLRFIAVHRREPRCRLSPL